MSPVSGEEESLSAGLEISGMHQPMQSILNLLNWITRPIETIILTSG